MKNNRFFDLLRRFVDGEVSFESKQKPKEQRRPSTHKEKTVAERYVAWHDKNWYKTFSAGYIGVSCVIALLIIGTLLLTVSYMPPYGEYSNPANNEVTERYLEDGMEETGAVNVVAGVILDYRAFDTFGESCVLFVASCSVMMLMTKEQKGKSKEYLVKYNPKRDPVVKSIAKIMVPFILMLGVYVVLNGHLSPGGGFSGGAIMGAGLILLSSAFGYRVVRTIITEKLVKIVTFVSLSFYALAKGYSFFTGANHLHSIISPGTPGRIISAGLILPLNIAVGCVVTMTMYSFYALFTREEL